MINNDYKYSEITERIIKCSFHVHNTLGGGFQEVIYQKALAIEFANEGLSYIREQEMPIYYRDILVGERRVDFLVEEKILVELKAFITIQDVHLAQAINYLEAFKLEVGLLINFGGGKLEFKRLMKNAYQLRKGNQYSYKDYKGQS